MTYTDHESDTIRAGVLGAIALVSRADSGFLASLRESLAAGRALTELPEELRDTFAEFDVPTLVAYVSRVMTLEPGDVILTGTPEGVGPLEAGDRLVVGVEGLGELALDVRAARARSPG